MTLKKKNACSIPPADPRLAFWGVILVGLGIWIAIDQRCATQGPAPKNPHHVTAR